MKQNLKLKLRPHLSSSTTLTTTTNEQLLSNTQKLIQTERKTLAHILEHLREIQKRRAYCPLGYSNLMKYMIHELGYSESASFRRIQALKLTKAVPEAAQMIQTGDLNLSQISMVQTRLKDEEKKIPKLLQNLKKKTARETEQILSEIKPLPKKREIKRSINSSESRIAWNLSNDVLKKMDKLQALTKKNNKNDLLSLALDLAIKKHDPTQRPTRKSNKTCKKVSALTKKKLYVRSNGVCEFPGCDEDLFLEIEHKTPQAFGGSHRLENLKLYCKSHNQHEAIKIFGQEVMDRYLN
jgi:hypothetical protein